MRSYRLTGPGDGISGRLDGSESDIMSKHEKQGILGFFLHSTRYLLVIVDQGLISAENGWKGEREKESGGLKLYSV